MNKLINHKQYSVITESITEKYVVLRKFNALGWSVVHESKDELSLSDARAVYNYQTSFGKVDPRALLIVKVRD